MGLAGRTGNQPKWQSNKKGSMSKIHHNVDENVIMKPITVYNICDVHLCSVWIYTYITWKRKTKVCSVFLLVKVVQGLKTSNIDPKECLICTRADMKHWELNPRKGAGRWLYYRLSPEGLGEWWQNPENGGIGKKWREEELLNPPALPNWNWFLAL